MVAGDEARGRLAADDGQRRRTARAPAGSRWPGCACAARRPCSAPAPPARRRRPARAARASAPAAARGRRGRSAAARPPRRRRRRTTASARAPRSRWRTRAAAPSSTTQTGIDGEQTPVIGPTWSCSLPGASAIVAAREQRRRLRRASPAQPSNSTAASSARRCGSHTRSHVIGGPECSSTPSRSPGTTAPAGATVTACGAQPSITRTACALAAATARPCRPHSRVSTSSISGSPPAGGRQSTCDDRRALLAQRVGERLRAPGSRPRRGAARRLEGSCAPPRWLNDRDGRSRRAGRAGHDRTRAARQARPRGRQAPGRRPRRRRRRADPARGRVHRHLRRGDLAAVPARRPVRRRAPPRWSRTSPTSGPWARRPHGIVDMLVSPDKDHAAAGARRPPLGGGPARRPDPRRAPDARPRARAVGLLHRLHDSAAARHRRATRRRPAGRVRDRRPVHERRPTTSSPRSATARPSLLQDRRRGARRGRRTAASATPPATSRCPASPARCCR